MPDILKIHPSDNVVVAIRGMNANEQPSADDLSLRLRDEIPAGHKIAIRQINKGEQILKYGHSIGYATQNIAPGSWVHSHNLATALNDTLEYRYEPVTEERPPVTGEKPTFMGYRRANGKVGTRNEVWIINTVGCVNRSAERIATTCNANSSDRVFDGVHAFSHPYGCSQLGDDLINTQKVLAGLIRHPNAGGVLVIGLGCENNQMDDLLKIAGDVDRSRMRYFNSQEVEDEVESGVQLVGELVEEMKQDQREVCPVSDLVLAMKCGGSDAFSGVTANPLVGRLTDLIAGFNGTSILTEVPEMFGAEQQLMNRAKDQDTFERIVNMINEFKEYFIRHGQPVYENPSPGNKEGGITTLEEKSLGAIQKGGQAMVEQVLDYGEAVHGPGLALLNAPGNDGVSCTAQVVSGATVLLFTTGRGTPLGFPVPTIKIASNTPLATKKPNWIDFNAGTVLDGDASLDELSQTLFETVVRVASGQEQTKNELNDYREIAIFKDGVTL